MLKRFKFLFKAGVGIAGCVAAIGAAQATSLTVINNVKGDRTWQDIASASYTFADANHDGQLNVGESLTLTIDMHKSHWGMHSFDALKVWIGDKVYTDQWNFSTSDTRGNAAYSGAGPEYTLGNHSFSFNYIADTVGALDIYASVMCNDDLSKLYYDGPGTTGSLANPSDNDWNAWTKNTHKQYGDRNQWIQGETEKYKLTVVQQPVPEPETYAMLLVGLGLLGFTARRRKDFNA